MNDLIELSDAELALVTGGGHGSHPARSAGSGVGLGLGHNVGLGLARSAGVAQTNNSVIIEISLAFNINSPGAIAIAGNSATSLQAGLWRFPRLLGSVPIIGCLCGDLEIL
jgi:hypothetical protein